MNILYVYVHPEKISFNGAMKDRALQVLQSYGHHVMVSDLYEMKFKAVADRDDFFEITNPNYFNYLIEQKHAFRDGYLFFRYN